MSKTVITYGTFDLFHVGHVNLLNRLKELGDELIVAVSTDSFNEGKGKHTVISYDDRAAIVNNIKCVDRVIPEEHWQQKREDVQRLQVDVLGMGADWDGEFDSLQDICEVVYLPRTENVSSTRLKKALGGLDKKHLEEVQAAASLLQSILESYR